MSVPVTSGFISTLYGVNGVPPTVSDAQLAANLAPYLGTLPTAPFTLNMTLNARDQVLAFFNFIYPGISALKNSQPSSDFTSPPSDFAQSFQDLLSVAQTPQAVREGMPAPIPPNSGGLARNTASALGTVIASLQAAFQNEGYTLSPTQIPTDDEINSVIPNWGQKAENQALVTAALAQLNQDIPVNTISIQLPGNDAPTIKTIPLNQSLQEVLETQYVDRGSKIIFSGLQALYDQQDQANSTLGLLTQLQQVYNGIKAVAGSATEFTVISDPDSLQVALQANIESTLLSSLEYEGVDPTVSVGFNSINVSWNDLNTDGSVFAQGNVVYTMDQQGLWARTSYASTGQAAAVGDIILNLVANSVAPPPATTEKSLNDILTTNYTRGPGGYVGDLAGILKLLFPKLGVQVDGASLDFGANGNFQLLLNKLYQSYLLQAAQRLINAVNINQTVIYPDLATGMLIVNPGLKDTNPTLYQSAIDQLKIIFAIQNYASTYKTTSSGSGQNLPVPGEAGYPASIIPIPAQDGYDAVSRSQFGLAESGTLEDSLLVILQNLVGTNAIMQGEVSGSATPPVQGYLVADSAGTTIDPTKWIKGNWPTGQGDATSLGNDVPLDQTQSYLSNAFSAASSVNDSLQQQLKQSFFLFQQFVQSATSALSSINKIIVKMAQNISSR